MKFTLKDYQETAVGGVLINFFKAAKRWKEDGDKHAFSLTATTGAGKTVMAAAVFEALFYGDNFFDFEADPGAVVIWFSDDPSLNEQTRFRLMEASDRLDINDLIVVENTFNKEKFKPRKIYFLNTQKLSKSSLLVRGHDSAEDIDLGQGDLFPDIRPDLRAFTIWDTIQNTIDDPNLNLYLVLDEAHRGMSKSSESNQRAKSTIVKRLMNGSGAISAIPIVWGISATVNRFNQAIEEAQGRSTLPNVIVNSAKVQESGLLKDTIVLDIPGKVGHFDTVLVRRATEKIKASTIAWNLYAKEQKGNATVVPLMVLQVPNTPDPNEIGRALDAIYSEWPDLDDRSIAHVFGEHKLQVFGRHKVPYISPQRVQETIQIRILIAKDAISTGWDCPRAEVMISFRPAKDRTHITQLLGRMVRTPLARRIPGNEQLNSVNCLLPFFDAKSVEEVADALMKGNIDGGDAGLFGRRVLINPVDLIPNSEIQNDVWEKFENLISQTIPNKRARPVKRLTAVAQELAADGLFPDAGKKAHAEMHKVLDAAKARFAEELVQSRKSVLKVEGKSLKADLDGQNKTFDDFIEDADFTVIGDFFRRSARSLSPDLAKTYVQYVAKKNSENISIEDALLEAQTDVASIGLVPQIQEYLEREADNLTKAWLEDNRIKIKGLSEERQETYKVLKSWSRDPQEISVVKPSAWIVATTVFENQIEIPLPRYKSHLMCIKEDKLFPCEMNGWELKVLESEMARDGFIAWYRNPQYATQESLAIDYLQNEDHHLLRPDFIFFHKNKNGSIAVDIVDPHGYHLSDALPKLIGLSRFAEKFAKTYRRIEVVAKIGEQLRVLDLTEDSVRNAVYNSEGAKSLFESPLAQDY